MAASKPTCVQNFHMEIPTEIHTRMHMNNRVPLVWGSLSLSPIMVFTIIKEAIKAVISIGIVPTCMIL